MAKLSIYKLKITRVNKPNKALQPTPIRWLFRVYSGKRSSLPRKKRILVR